MFKLTRRNVQGVYTLVQAFFWAAFTLMFSFCSAYLLHRGFSNRGIGLVLGCSYGLSALLQPAIASCFARKGIEPERGLCALYGVAALLALALLLAPLPSAAFALVMVGMFSVYSSLQPLVNSLAQQWTDAGFAVTFSKARGAASLLFSVVTAGMGWLLQRISPLMLPLFYLTVILLSMALLLLIRFPDVQSARQKTGVKADKQCREYPSGFPLLLAGIACLSLGHIMVENFMLQIMQSFGGTTQDQGIAAGIASLVEVPALWLYSRISRRSGHRALLVFSAWAWFGKILLISLAHSLAAIYAAETLQFCSYGFYTPASVHCIDSMFPPEGRLRGQSLTGSAYTLGCVLAALAGGVLLDALGVSYALFVMVAVMLLGAVLVSLSARKQKKEGV